jgi:CBS-domain-containing membrane protein
MNELALDAVTGRTVAEVMLKRPKTLPAAASVADARRVFENPKVQTCPIVDEDGALVAELDREQLPEDAAAGASAASYASAPLTIRPDAPVQEALDQLTALGSERMCVVDAEGRMLGLLCLNGRHSAFCTDRS